MAYERLVRRTIYVAQCSCGERIIRDDNPPKSRLCSCGEWVDYVAETYTGPDRFDGK